MELRKCRTEIIIRYLYNCIVSFFCSDCKTKLLFRGCFFHNPTPGGYFLPNLCAQPRQKPVKVCISAPDKLHPAKAAAAPGSQRRKRQRRPAPQVRCSQLCPAQRPARLHIQRALCHPDVRTQRRKALGTGKTIFKHPVLQAAFPLCVEHHRRQQRGGVRGKARVGCCVHVSRATQCPEPRNGGSIACPLYGAAHLFQNFQQRGIQPGCAARQFYPAARRCCRASQRRGDDAVCHRHEGAARKAAPSLHPDGVGARPLHAAAAGVEEGGKIRDLRLFCSAMQHGLSLRRGGGQQQRLCIARALAVKPEVLLMDEPTSALDPGSTMKVEELMSELKKNYTVVIVTHNMQQAARISDRTAFFLLGELVEAGPTAQIFSTPQDKRTEDYISGRFG